MKNSEANDIRLIANEILHRHVNEEKTNLQAAGNSVVAAFEVFDKINPNESFAVWCDTKAKEVPVLPKWVRPDALFTYGFCSQTTRCVREVTHNEFTDWEGRRYSGDSTPGTFDWQHCFVTPQLPDWIKPGQWIQMKNLTNGSLYLRKIAKVDDTYVTYTNRQHDALWCVRSDAVPLTIKPWTLVEAEAAMDAGVQIRYNGYKRVINCVRRHRGGPTCATLIEIGSFPVEAERIFTVVGIATNLETWDHKPCGTPVPM